jgi:Protein of unknown function (DUF2971)
MIKDTLYKYRSWKDEFHQASLKKRELFFAAPGSLNDPLDFSVRPSFSNLSANEINAYIETVIIDLPVAVEKIEQFKIEFFKYIKEKPEEFKRDYDTAFAKKEDLYYGMLCFSHRWNSGPMWAHYADNHTGFCLGFTKQKFIEKYFGYSGPVNYVNELPIIPPSTDLLRKIFLQTSTKLNDWQYEDEFRFLKMNLPEPHTSDTRRFTYPKEYLKEIILGLHISDKDKSEIRDIAKQLKVPLYQIIKNQTEFEKQILE